MNPLKICFFGLDNYRVLQPGGSKSPVNGEAVQQVLLARALRDHGCCVSMIVEETNGNPVSVVDGIKVIQAFRYRDGLPGVRFFHPRLSGVLRALHQANADVYYQSPAGAFTGVTAAFCNATRKRFIFRVASDANCVPGKQLIRFWRDRKIYEYGLRKANAVAVQTRYQQSLLRQFYKRDSVLVDMIMEPPSDPACNFKDIDVLFINNLRPVKRPELVIELARALPNCRFTMIGGVADNLVSYFERIKQQAEMLPNMRFLGQQTLEETNNHILRTKILLNTSTVEGFPNSFLQAWSRAVPVVSSFDPDNLIASENLGIPAKDPATMLEAIRFLLENPARRLAIGQHARSYTLARFSPARVVLQYLKLITV